MILTADRVVLPAGLLAPGWVRPTATGSPTPAGARRPRRPTGTSPGPLVPGFVDPHCHGGGGASFDHAVTPRRGDRRRDATCAHGTTTMVASLVTDTRDRLDRARCAALAPLVRRRAARRHPPRGAVAQRPRTAGAHDPALLRRTRPGGGRRAARRRARGTVRMVTLAPELDRRARRRRACSPRRGVVAALGHTDATYDVARAALDAGATRRHPPVQRDARRCTTASPARCSRCSSARRVRRADRRRRPPAPRGAALGRRRRRRGRFVLVTDAMGAAGAADGDYLLGPAAVEVRDGVARLARRRRHRREHPDDGPRRPLRRARCRAAARRRRRGGDGHPGPRARARPTSVRSSRAGRRPTSCTSTTTSRSCG